MFINKKKVVSIIVLSLVLTQTPAVFAQKNNQNQVIKKDIIIRYRIPSDIYQIVKVHVSKGENVHFSDKLGIITLQASKETVAEVEDLIKKYDTPFKKIWLQVSLIDASENGEKKLDYPEEIADVVKQLKSLFKFSKYEIISRADAMGIEGKEISFGTSQKKDSDCNFTVNTMLGYSEDIIKLNQLKIYMHYRVKDDLFTSNDLSTSINIKDGETVVLGASRDTAQPEAVITIVTAKVMN
ncbi:MAG: hypothetical protein R6V04_16415 [bacterium]